MTDYTIHIKPLSVNSVWQGRRFKTQTYLDYEKELFYLLPRDLKIPDGKLKLEVEVGVSSKNCDVDNFLKPLIDILSKKYQFNDKNIYQIIIKKNDIKKKEEFIKFKISKCE